MVRISHLSFIIGCAAMLVVIIAASQAEADDGPFLEVTEPLEHTWTNNSTIWVKGWTAPDITVTASIEASRYRDEPELAPRNTTVSGLDGSFALMIDLTEGIQKLWVEATDGEGNITLVDLFIILDTTPPALIVTQPPESPWLTNEETYTIVMCSLYDCMPEHITINGVEVVHRGEAKLTVDLEEGNNTFDLRASDRVGNTWTGMVVIIRDTLPPVLEIGLLPGDDMYTNETPIVLTGHVSGASGPVTVGMIVITREAELVNGSWEDGATWEYKVHIVYDRQKFTIVAQDRAGNSVSREVWVNYDPDPPDLHIEAIPRFQNLPFQWLNGTTSMDIDIVLINGIKYPVINGRFEVQYLIGDGDNRIQIVVEDKAGNRRTESFDVFNDRQAPSIGLNVVGFSLRSTVHIRGRTDMEGGVIYINGEPNPLPTREFHLERTLSEGGNEFEIVVVDQAGNTSSRTVSVVYVNPWLLVIIALLPIMGGVLFRWYKVRIKGRQTP